VWAPDSYPQEDSWPLGDTSPLAIQAAVIEATNGLIRQNFYDLSPKKLFEDTKAAAASLGFSAGVLQSVSHEVYMVGWLGSWFCGKLLGSRGELAEGLAGLRLVPGASHTVHDVILCVFCSYSSHLLGMQELPVGMSVSGFEHRLGLREGELIKLGQLMSELQWEDWEDAIFPAVQSQLQKLDKK
jgi:hypothetical protein